jgi:NAD-dependent SIR2 family protein deacetylase
MSFMQMFIYRKGALYSADCRKCGMTNYTHEWVRDDHNERRDALENGTARCDECGGPIDATTFYKAPRPMYAGRYSAPGYLDCTDWSYDANKRRLEKELRDMYGDDDAED